MCVKVLKQCALSYLLNAPAFLDTPPTQRTSGRHLRAGVLQQLIDAFGAERVATAELACINIAECVHADGAVVRCGSRTGRFSHRI